MVVFFVAYVICAMGWFLAYFFTFGVVIFLTIAVLVGLYWLHEDTKGVTHTTPGVGMLFIAGIIFLAAIWITEFFIHVDLGQFTWHRLSSAHDAIFRK